MYVNPSLGGTLTSYVDISRGFLFKKSVCLNSRGRLNKSYLGMYVFFCNNRPRCLVIKCAGNIYISLRARDN